MDDIHTILIKKANGNTIYNSYDNFSMACLNFPFKVFGDTKELPANDWKDENGLDTYFPKKLYIKPYDIKVEFGYVGQELSSGTPNVTQAMNAVFAFYKFLTGNDTSAGSGTELTIYSPFTGIGRRGIYAIGMDNENARFMLKQDGNNLYNENVLTFSITFKVCEPVTQVALNG